MRGDDDDIDGGDDVEDDDDGIYFGDVYGDLDLVYQDRRGRKSSRGAHQAGGNKACKIDNDN